MSKGTFRTDEAMRDWIGRVATVAEQFERRWALMSLARVDAELATRLHEQRRLFDHACLVGTVSDIETQGGGMMRGWAAAIRAMEQAGAADDAYMLGADPVSGLKVAIGTQKAAAGRVVELHGADVVWLTPDEVAAMMAQSQPWGEHVAAIKRQWPGAEIVRYGSEGS